MRGAYYQYIKTKGVAPSLKSDAVEEAHAKRKEDAELRLAKIQNGKDPRYKNGKNG